MSQFLAEEIARIPAAPPRDVDLLPGLRFSKSVSRQTIWVPLFFVIVAPLFLIAIMSITPEARLALGTTRTAEGRVESVDQRSGCRGGAHIAYTFETPDGVTQRGRDQVCPPNPNARVAAGDLLPIRYLEGDPAVSEVTGTNPRGLLYLVPFLMIPLLFLVIFGVILGPPLRRHWRDRKLFRTGELASGRVTFIKSRREIPWQGGAPFYTRAEVFVRARFQSGEREVTAHCANEWLLANLPPGAEVHVCAVGDEAMLVENYLR